MWEQCEAELEMQIDELCNLDPGSIPTEQDVFDIYSWIDSLEFSRAKKNITRDFSDGVLYAEMLSHYLPQIVNTRQFNQALSRKNKQNNWDHLTAKVLPKLGMKVDKTLLRDIIDCKTGSIEKLLYSTRPFIARRNRTILDYRRKISGAVSTLDVVIPEVPKPKLKKIEPKNVESSGVSVFTRGQPVTQKPAPAVRQRSKPVKVPRVILPKMVDNNGNTMSSTKPTGQVATNSSAVAAVNKNLPKAFKGNSEGQSKNTLRPVETEVWNLDDAVSERQLEKEFPEAMMYVGNDEQIRQNSSILPADLIMYSPDGALGNLQKTNTYGLV